MLFADSNWKVCYCKFLWLSPDDHVWTKNINFVFKMSKISLGLRENQLKVCIKAWCVTCWQFCLPRIFNVIAKSEQVSTKPKLNRTQLCVKLSTKQHKTVFLPRPAPTSRLYRARVGSKQRGMKRAPNTNYCQHDFHFSLNFLAGLGEAFLISQLGF